MQLAFMAQKVTGSFAVKVKTLPPKIQYELRTNPTGNFARVLFGNQIPTPLINQDDCITIGPVEFVIHAVSSMIAQATSSNTLYSSSGSTTAGSTSIGYGSTFGRSSTSNINPTNSSSVNATNFMTAVGSSMINAPLSADHVAQKSTFGLGSSAGILPHAAPSKGRELPRTPLNNQFEAASKSVSPIQLSRNINNIATADVFNPPAAVVNELAGLQPDCRLTLFELFLPRLMDSLLESRGGPGDGSRLPLLATVFSIENLIGSCIANHTYPSLGTFGSSTASVTVSGVSARPPAPTPLTHARLRCMSTLLLHALETDSTMHMRPSLRLHCLVSSSIQVVSFVLAHNLPSSSLPLSTFIEAFRVANLLATPWTAFLRMPFFRPPRILLPNPPPADPFPVPLPRPSISSANAAPVRTGGATLTRPGISNAAVSSTSSSPLPSIPNASDSAAARVWFPLLPNQVSDTYSPPISVTPVGAMRTPPHGLSSSSLNGSLNNNTNMDGWKRTWESRISPISDASEMTTNQIKAGTFLTSHPFGLSLVSACILHPTFHYCMTLIEKWVKLWAKYTVTKKRLSLIDTLGAAGDASLASVPSAANVGDGANTTRASVSFGFFTPKHPSRAEMSSSPPHQTSAMISDSLRPPPLPSMLEQILGLLLEVTFLVLTSPTYANLIRNGCEDFVNPSVVDMMRQLNCMPPSSASALLISTPMSRLPANIDWRSVCLTPPVIRSGNVGRISPELSDALVSAWELSSLVIKETEVGYGLPSLPSLCRAFDVMRHNSSGLSILLADPIAVALPETAPASPISRPFANGNSAPAVSAPSYTEPPTPPNPVPKPYISLTPVPSSALRAKAMGMIVNMSSSLGNILTPLTASKRKLNSENNLKNIPQNLKTVVATPPALLQPPERSLGELPLNGLKVNFGSISSSFSQNENNSHALPPQFGELTQNKIGNFDSTNDNNLTAGRGMFAKNVAMEVAAIQNDINNGQKKSTEQEFQKIDSPIFGRSSSTKAHSKAPPVVRTPLKGSSSNVTLSMYSCKWSAPLRSYESTYLFSLAVAIGVTIDMILPLLILIVTLLKHLVFTIGSALKAEQIVLNIFECFGLNIECFIIEQNSNNTITSKTPSKTPEKSDVFQTPTKSGTTSIRTATTPSKAAAAAMIEVTAAASTLLRTPAAARTAVKLLLTPGSQTSVAGKTTANDWPQVEWPRLFADRRLWCFGALFCTLSRLIMGGPAVIVCVVMAMIAIFA